MRLILRLILRRLERAFFRLHICGVLHSSRSTIVLQVVLVLYRRCASRDSAHTTYNCNCIVLEYKYVIYLQLAVDSLLCLHDSVIRH